MARTIDADTWFRRLKFQWARGKSLIPPDVLDVNAFASLNNPQRPWIFVLLWLQIEELSKGSKFEAEIREEQEMRKRDAEMKKKRQAEFREKAALFGQQR